MENNRVQLYTADVDLVNDYTVDVVLDNIEFGEGNYIYQITTEKTEDATEITIELTNGTKTTFDVPDGEKGDKGDPYEYYFRDGLKHTQTFSPDGTKVNEDIVDVQVNTESFLSINGENKLENKIGSLTYDEEEKIYHQVKEGLLTVEEYKNSINKIITERIKPCEEVIDNAHERNKDTQIISENENVAVKVNNENVQVIGKSDFSNDVTINGNLYVQGESYEVHGQTIYTNNDKVIVRDGATTAIKDNDIAGLKVIKADGATNTIIGVDNKGIARIGDEGGNLEALLTRDEAENLKDHQPLCWDSENQKAISHIQFKVMTLDNFLAIRDAEQIEPYTYYFTYEDELSTVQTNLTEEDIV